LDRGKDIRTGDAASCKRLGVEPHPDAIVSFAKDIDVRHAIDPQQLIANHNRGEIAQINIVVSSI